MPGKHPSVREVVEYGLDRISPDRTVSVPVRELVRIFKSFEELNAFFHQPMHYPNLDAVHAFLGSQTDGGAYQVISEALYDILPAFFPTTSCEMLSLARSNTRNPSRIEKADGILPDRWLVT